MRQRIPKLDVGRLGKAVSYPGIDPRVWASYGLVKSFKVTTNEGVFATVKLMPSETLVSARVGAVYAGNGFGIYAPLEIDDEVLVTCPLGDFNEGATIVARMWSAADKPPAIAGTSSRDVVIHVKSGQTLRIIASGSGKVVVDAPLVELGQEDLGNNDGVVHGSGIDPFTGLSYTFLGNVSEIVKAEK